MSLWSSQFVACYLIMAHFFQEIVLSSDGKCNCSMGISHLLALKNETCFDACYLEKLKDENDTQLIEYFDISPEKILDIFQTPEETWISLSLAAESVFSFYNTKEFSCQMTMIWNYETSITGSSVNSNCYIISDPSRKDTSLIEQQFGPISRISVIKISDRTSLIKTTNLSPKFKISCLFYGHYNSLHHYSVYPLVLKSPIGLVEPANDMQLAGSIRRYTKTVGQLDLQWKCPSFWDGTPKQYNIRCERYVLYISPSIAVQLLPALEKNVTWTEHKTRVFYGDDTMFNGDSVFRSEWNEIGAIEPRCSIRAEIEGQIPIFGAYTPLVPVKFTRNKALDALQIIYGGLQACHEESPIKQYKATIHMVMTPALQPWAEFEKENFVFCRNAHVRDMAMEAEWREPFPDGLISIPIGCYDWIAQRWMLLAQRKTTGHEDVIMESPEWARISVSNPGTVLYRTGKPIQMACMPGRGMLIWTEFNKTRKETQLFTVEYEVRNGFVQLDMPSLLLKSTENRNCPQHIVSPAIDLTQDLEESLVLFVAEDGLWSMDIRIRQCVPRHHFSKKHFTFAKIQMEDVLAMVEIDDLYVVTKNQPNQITKFTLDGPVQISQRMVKGSKINSKQLYNYPGYPVQHSWLVDLQHKINETWTEYFGESYIQKLRTLPEDWQIVKLERTVTDVLLYQIPPECLVPIIQNVTFTMISAVTATMEVYMSKNLSRSKCSSFKNGPPIRLEGDIGRVNTSMDMNQCSNVSCTCNNISSLCLQFSGDPTEHQRVEISLSNLRNGDTYFVVIRAKPWREKSCYAFINDLDFQPVTDYQLILQRLIAEVGALDLAAADATAFRTTFRADYTPDVLTRTNVPVILGATIPLSLLLVAAIVTLVYFYKRRWHIYQQLPRVRAQQLNFTCQLGAGHFGAVYEASFKRKKSSKATVAVKLLKDTASDLDKRQFLEEALLMSKLDCEYIIRPLGICMSKPIVLVLEFLSGGSVLSYLRKDTTRNTLTTIHLLHIGMDVCKACAYMEAKGYIHRDISAKNCLVALGGHSPIALRPVKVKLADFGMAKDISVRDVYSVGEDAVFPIPYTAPEGLNGDFSIKSDVFSYGILLWEIFTWCADVYGKCYFELEQHHRCPLRQFSMAEIERRVCLERKTLLDLPSPCTATITPSIREIVEKCLSFDPDQRPSFKELVEKSLSGVEKDKSEMELRFPLRSSNWDFGDASNRKNSNTEPLIMKPVYGASLSSDDDFKSSLHMEKAKSAAMKPAYGGLPSIDDHLRATRDMRDESAGLLSAAYQTSIKPLDPTLEISMRGPSRVDCDVNTKLNMEHELLGFGYSNLPNSDSAKAELFTATVV